MTATECPKCAKDELRAELERLLREAWEHVRNYPRSEQIAAQDGTQRTSAAPNERMAREKFARAKELRGVLGIPDRTAGK